MKLKRMCFIVLFILTPFFPDGLSATTSWPFEKRSFELENGLRVFLEKKNTLPLVNIVFSIKVGSKNDAAGTGGSVHMLEHLIFSHDIRNPGGNGNRELFGGWGVLTNGYTSHDMMTLEFTAPPDRLEYALEMIRDRVFHLRLDSSKIAKEKEIILEEIAEQESNPLSVGMELLFKELFAGHPYAHPIGGDRESLNRITVNGLNALKEKYVTPDNCVLVAAGNFDIVETEKKVNALFNSAGKTNPAPDTDNGKTGIHSLEKNKSVEKVMNVNEAHLLIGFPAPGRLHEDGLPLEVLTKVFSQDGGGLLAQALNQSRVLVKGATMFYYPFEMGGALVIYIITKPRNIKTIKRTLFRFLNNEVEPIDYTRSVYGYRHKAFALNYLGFAINVLRMEYRESLERGLARAGYHSQRIHYGGNSDSPGYEKRLLYKLKPEDLPRVASRYLIRKNVVEVTILPDSR